MIPVQAGTEQTLRIAVYYTEQDFAVFPVRFLTIRTLNGSSICLRNGDNTEFVVGPNANGSAVYTSV